MGSPVLSVVVPAYNEEAVLTAFHLRLSAILDAWASRAEVLYVNDGSDDRTLAVVNRLHAARSAGRRPRPVAQFRQGGRAHGGARIMPGGKRSWSSTPTCRIRRS